jgi:hypothetical protein
MKKYIIKIGKKLLIPVIILGGCSFVFDAESKGVPYIIYIRWGILILAIILMISGILQFFDDNSKNKKES